MVLSYQDCLVSAGQQFINIYGLLESSSGKAIYIIEERGHYSVENQVKDSKERVYEFLVKFFIENGFAPSFKEISIGTGIKSTSTIHEKLAMLDSIGLIKIMGNSPRAIKIVGYNYTKEGNDMENINESNQIKKEIFNNVIANLKKEVPLLSETEIQRIRDVFYSGTENYLFKRKGE